MSHFEYIMVMVSIILGLGLTPALFIVVLFTGQVSFRLLPGLSE